MTYSYRNPPENARQIGEFLQTWRNPDTGDWTLAWLADGLESGEVTLTGGEAEEFSHLVLSQHKPVFASPAENTVAVNAETGADGERVRIHAAEALHRAGRM